VSKGALASSGGTVTEAGTNPFGAVAAGASPADAPDRR
jgi:hypothetical protein